MNSGLFLHVVVAHCPVVLEAFACEHQSHLIRRDAFPVLDLSLHIPDCVRGLDVKGYGSAREGLNENLHGYYCCGFGLLCILVDEISTV